GGALQENILYPLSLCGGLIISFVTIGWSIAAFGSLLGLESSTIRAIAGVGLVCAGLALLIPMLQEKLAGVLSPLADKADGTLLRNQKKGAFGYFFAGLLLGAVWSPCSGPTLGSAIALASSEGGGLASGIMMLCFALGAVVPLLAVSYGAQGWIKCNRDKITKAVTVSKKVFGVMLVVVGICISLGWDKKAETFLVERMPNAWVDFTAKF
ncbi:MAG: cytochrome c biogenesis CcdA family protein, partial [Bdellovibrionia bacterium]